VILLDGDREELSFVYLQEMVGLELMIGPLSIFAFSC